MGDAHKIAIDLVYQHLAFIQPRAAFVAHSTSHFSMLASEVHTLAARVLDTTIFGLSSWQQLGPLGLALEGAYYQKKGEDSFLLGSIRPELTFYKKNKIFSEYIYNGAANTSFDYPFLASQPTIAFFDRIHNIGIGLDMQPLQNFNLGAVVVHKGSTRTSYSKFALEYQLKDRWKVKATYVDNFSASTRSFYLLAQYHFS
jgi:hypothetical protein